MQLKSILTIVLLVFVLGSFAAIIAKEMRSSTPETQSTVSASSREDSSAPAADAADPNPALEHQVIAYYFHGTARCATCRTIEAYTREAILSGFTDDLQKQNLVWKVVNVDEPENQHFVTDYQLHTKSVVLVDTRKGQQTQWKKSGSSVESGGQQRKFPRLYPG